MDISSFNNTRHLLKIYLFSLSPQPSPYSGSGGYASPMIVAIGHTLAGLSQDLGRVLPPINAVCALYVQVLTSAKYENVRHRHCELGIRE